MSIIVEMAKSFFAVGVFSIVVLIYFLTVTMPDIPKKIHIGKINIFAGKALVIVQIKE